MNKLEHNILRKMNRAKTRTNVNEGTGFPALKDIPVARDCNELKMSGVLLTGVYPVKLPNGLVLNVLCDMDMGQGGWTVIQRRLDGSINFTRVWDDYTFGFGNVNGEFWLGNENIYNLLHDTNYTLRIDIWDWEDDHAYAQYSYMKLDGEDQDYRLHLGTYNGTAGDSFSYHNGMRFTTPDRDNDMWWANCGKKDQSGWWFNACSYSSLNGVYHRLDNTTQPRRPSPDGTHTGVQWFNWKSDPAYSMKRVEMKVKPKIAIMIENQDELRDPVYG